MSKSLLNIDLSIVVPCFNEEKNLEEAIKTNLDDGRRYLKRFEIIIVDDGSTDNSFSIGKKLSKKYPHVGIVAHKKNIGLGAAIQTGIRIANYNFITYLPSDGQVYLRDILTGLQKAKGADLVLTYRTKRSDYRLYRKFISWCVVILLRFLFGLGYRDYNWVHIYKKNIFSKIDVKSKGVFFLSEVVIKAHKAHLKIVEAESIYRSRKYGKSKTAKLGTICHALYDLLLLRFNLFYSKKNEKSKSKN